MGSKSLGEKSCEINGGSHEMAAMMLTIIMHKAITIINIIAAISCLILQLFHSDIENFLPWLLWSLLSQLLQISRY